MAYIGKSPAVGNFVKLDAISTSSTNTYNLTLDSVAFVPESANHMLVSLNGVIQAPLTSFSVSGSTITFLPSSGTLSSSDSIDFIMVYGNVLDIGTPSDSTVTNAKTNFVSTSSSAGLEIKGDGTTDGTLQLNCRVNSHGIKLKSPPHSAGASYTLTFPNNDGDADQFLQTNGSGTLTWAEAGGGMNLIYSTDSVTSAVFNIDNVFTSTYKCYKMFVFDLYPSSDSEVQFNFRSGGASGTIQNTSNYKNTGIRQERNSGGNASVNIANDYWGQSYGDINQSMESGNTQKKHFAEWTIWNPYANLPTYYRVLSQNTDNSGAYIVAYDNQGVYDHSAVITGIALNTSAGSWSGGSVRIYGLKDS